MSLFPIILTKDQVFAAAKGHFDAGTLQAQKAKRGRVEGCAYRDRNGYPCGVGASMTDEQVAALKKWRRDRQSGNKSTIQTLIQVGVVRIVDADGSDDPVGVESVCELQRVHDGCIVYNSYNTSYNRTLPELGAFIDKHAPRMSQ